MITKHERSFASGETKYKLEHYIDVLELKPRAVRQAQPIRSTVHPKIQNFRNRIETGPKGDREYVKILRLLLDYGQNPLLKAIEECKLNGACSYEAVRFTLMQNLQTLEEVSATTNKSLNLGPEIINHNLSRYDTLMKAGELR